MGLGWLTNLATVLVHLFLSIFHIIFQTYDSQYLLDVEVFCHFMSKYAILLQEANA